MLRRFLWMLAFGALYLPAVAQNARRPDEAAVLAAARAETEAYLRGDLQATLALWRPDVKPSKYLVGNGSYQTYVGLPQIERFYADDIDARAAAPEITLTIENEDVHVAGDFAFAAYDQVMRGTFNGLPIDTRNRELRTLERQGGRWKITGIYSLMGSTYKPREENVELSLNNAGYLLLAMGNLDEAIEVFTLATKYYPKSARVWDSLAEANLKAGKTDRAAEYFRRSLSLNPKNRNAENHLRELQPQ